MEQKICPRCGSEYTSTTISDNDKFKEICTQCQTNESIKYYLNLNKEEINQYE